MFNKIANVEDSLEMNSLNLTIVFYLFGEKYEQAFMEYNEYVRLADSIC